MQSILASNHSGREADRDVNSLAVVPDIVDEIEGELNMLFNSWIRCGADIDKAKTCLVRWPYLYGLVLGGENGASHVIKVLLAEFQLTLHLAGITSCRARDLNRGRVVMQSYL